MSATASYSGLELGIPDEIKETALAYLVVVLENARPDRLDEDVQALSELLSHLGALDVFVLPAAAAAQLIDAREKAFWMAKASGADDIVDIVVPRAQIPDFMERVSALAGEYEAWIAGAGMPATATSTSASSAATTSGGPGCSPTCSTRGCGSAAPSRRNTASDAPRRRTTWPSRTRPRSP